MHFAVNFWERYTEVGNGLWSLDTYKLTCLEHEWLELHNWNMSPKAINYKVNWWKLVH